VASGLSAHLFAAVISIGSSLSQNKHFNSVRPLELGIGTILFPQCKQRVTRSMVTSGSTSQPSSGTLVPNRALALDDVFVRTLSITPPRNGQHIRLLTSMDRFCLLIICASVLLLVTAFALGTPGLKSEGPPEKAPLLRVAMR
jgi:hypothetical protein